MSDSNSLELLCVPPELRVLAETAAQNLLPLGIEEILRGRV